VTAEIAIMNKSAVALAADSAVTIDSDRGPKIFNTVNKLFALSKHYPVAVMVYGNAQIMRVPWETIVKVYRARLGERSFKHLEDYAADFLSFLSRNRALFPGDDQADYFHRATAAFYQWINKDIETQVRKHLEKTGAISTSETRRITRVQIAKHFDHLRKCKRLRGFTGKFEGRLLRKYSSALRKLREEIFQKLPLSPTDLRRLRRISAWMFSKDNFPFRGTAGVVVAGFGQKDIYPRLMEFTVEGVIQDRLRFAPRRQNQIGRNCICSITPFAQTEVVQGFIDGVDPGMERLLNKFLDEVFLNYPIVILNHVKGISTAAKARVLKKTKQVSDQVLTKFRKEFEDFRKQTLVNPIVSMVSVLPKDELAAMAEALVNLTSFKRRFSPNAETVGGPIDVAVLSKGDGFIWVKRKHYFKPELNPHFSTNYFRAI
jgi:hypothetical protein